ncbi:IS21 family transposase [Paenibacillus sp. TRM 82003]|nr:IS21 family transposase [Paenibacillus sp. TRM 82003]
MIKELHQRGMNITQISNEELGRDRKTIRKWLEEGMPGTYSRTVKKPSKLDPFKEYIKKRMDEGCLNATVLYDEIKAMGYTGKTTMLRLFMQPIRPTVTSKATERFETPPGQQAQVDWGHFSVDWEGRQKRLYAFVKVLGYSRAMYVEFTEDEKLETLMGCHLRAMQYFGGRTETCLYDNMKTVVAGQDDRGEVVWNERFARFAAHHGFTLRRCKPYRARTKGKVENGVGYVRKNFWPRVREFTSLHDLNIQARRWLDSVANVRVHGTTHEVPLERLHQEGLKSINLTRFEVVERHVRKVSSDSLVSYDAQRYSVPFRFVGHLVQLQDDKNGMLRIFDGAGNLIAEHVKAVGRRHQMTINKQHFEGIRKAGGQKVPQPSPRLAPNPTPEVLQRDPSIYEQLAIEEDMLQ